MWELPKERHGPIYRAIMDLILNYIKTGQLEAGERLPSERQLATYFQVNRSTVVHALDELAALGWLVRRQGSGTRVNEGKWGLLTEARVDWHRYLDQNLFAQKNVLQQTIERKLKENPRSLIDAYTGELPVDLVPQFAIPALTWQDFLPENQLDELGYEPLRHAVQQELLRTCQLSVATDHLLITSGAQQALFLILQVLLRAGDSVAIEDPSFLYALPIFQAAGVRLYGVPMDAEGLRLDALEKLIQQKSIKLVIVNPTFQNPTGTVMSLKRRLGLIQLCQAYQLPIVEDDVFAQLSYRPENNEPPLKKLAPEQVLYIGSLSKILGSTTKIGWLAAPASVNQQLATARKVMDASLSIFPQVLARMVLEDATYPEKVMQVKNEIAQRGQAVYEVIAAHADWQVQAPTGGFYLWATYRKRALTSKDIRLFLEAGLIVAPSQLFSARKDALRINFARIAPQQLPIFRQKFAEITFKMSQ